MKSGHRKRKEEEEEGDEVEKFNLAATHPSYTAPPTSHSPTFGLVVESDVLPEEDSN